MAPINRAGPAVLGRLPDAAAARTRRRSRPRSPPGAHVVDGRSPRRVRGGPHPGLARTSSSMTRSRPTSAGSSRSGRRSCWSCPNRSRTRCRRRPPSSCRIGYDRIVGVLDGGVDALGRGRRRRSIATRHTARHAADGRRRRRGRGRPAHLLDVRDPNEWRDDGPWPGALEHPARGAAGRLDEVPRDAPDHGHVQVGVAGVDRGQHARRGRPRRAAAWPPAGRPTSSSRRARPGHVIEPRSTRSARRAARALDAADPLAGVRDRFVLPLGDGRSAAAYLAGNVARLPSRSAPRAAVEAVLDAWAPRGVDGWFEGERRWLDVERRSSARRRPGSSARGRTRSPPPTRLTINLHLLLAAFYRPAGRRTAILIDAPTFPSDRYAVESQLRHARPRPGRATSIVVRPRDGEALLRVEDLEAAIHEHRDRLALALLAGVNYATGRRCDVGRLTAAVHEAGRRRRAGTSPTPPATCRWRSTTPTSMSRRGAPTSTSTAAPARSRQLFVHERHADDPGRAGSAGWWGNDPATRFEMAETFAPAAGADGWRVSTPADPVARPDRRRRSRSSTRSGCRRCARDRSR